MISKKINHTLCWITVYAAKP